MSTEYLKCYFSTLLKDSRLYNILQQRQHLTSSLAMFQITRQIMDFYLLNHARKFEKDYLLIPHL